MSVELDTSIDNYEFVKELVLYSWNVVSFREDRRQK